MKVHTHKYIKHIKNIGAGTAALTLLAGAAAFANPTWAAEKTQTITVTFTFNEKLELTTSQSEMTIGSLTPGAVGESAPITVTVKTNHNTGCSLTATSGNEKGTSLAIGDAGTGGFTQLAENANKDKTQIDDNYWGVAFDANGDIATAKYNGLPQYNASGTGGKQLLNVTQPTGDSGKTVQVKAGAKAGAAMPPGTYQGHINFYVTANS